MVRPFKIFGYSLAGLGLFFLMLEVFLIFYSVKPLGASTVTYPYRPFVIASFVTGIICLGSGISGIWIDYFEFKKIIELRQTKNEA